MQRRRKFLQNIIKSMRLSQWTKNLAVFAAIIFNGKIFDPYFFSRTGLAFVAFSLLSSASYLINDIVDAPYDRQHLQKRNRPIARGEVTPSQAARVAVLLMGFSFVFAFYLGALFGLLLLAFLLIHLLYSFCLKRIAVLDILAISTSFIFRTLGGEAATGYHLPVWLMFTVIFLSLFLASGKRRSELLVEGPKTRISLKKYGRALLDFYTSIFAVATLISYSLFAYLSEPIHFTRTRVRDFLIEHIPSLVGRKWLMLTIIPIIFGIMRYSQLVLEKDQGQRPEKLLASDIPLILTIIIWGLMLITIVYVL